MNDLTIDLAKKIWIFGPYLIKVHADKGRGQCFSQNKLLTALKVFLLPLGRVCKKERYENAIEGENI